MKKSNVYSTKGLVCAHCGKDLTSNLNMSIVVLAQKDRITQSVYACCKGDCDEALKRRLDPMWVDGWKELSIFSNPYLFMNHVFAVMNNMQAGTGFANQKAFEDYKNIIVEMYPYVCRDMTPEEKKKAEFEIACPF